MTPKGSRWQGWRTSARLFDWLIQTVAPCGDQGRCAGEPMRRRLWDTYGKIKTPKTPTAADSPLDA